MHRMNPGQVHRGGAADHDDRVRAAGSEQLDAALRESLPGELDQRFRLAEPGAFPGGKQDARNTVWHGPQAYAPALIASIPNRE
jgi:hypothetical protein